MSSGRSLWTRQNRSDQGFTVGAWGGESQDTYGNLMQILLAPRLPPAGSRMIRTKLSLIEDPFVE